MLLKFAQYMPLVFAFVSASVTIRTQYRAQTMLNFLKKSNATSVC